MIKLLEKSYGRMSKAIHLHTKVCSILASANKIASNIMVSAMKKYGVLVGVIVFGAGHNPGLINELRKLGDFNIITVI
jgi:hypothetical protein